MFARSPSRFLTPSEYLEFERASELTLEDAHHDRLLNPRLIIEVLSPSTESYDHKEKFEDYRQIKSLVDYVLIAQDRPSINLFSRQGEMWRIESATGLDASLYLPALELDLALAEVYRRVEWPGGATGEGPTVRAGGVEQAGAEPNGTA